MALTRVVLACLVLPTFAWAEQSGSCSALASCTSCEASEPCGWFSCSGAAAACADVNHSGSCDGVPCGGPTCNSLVGVSIVAGDLSNAKANGTTDMERATDCCQRCKHIAHCEAWTLDLGNQHCYWKRSAAGGITHDSNFISSVVPPVPSFKMGCEHLPQSGFGYCNATLPRTARVADLISRLTLTEKLAMLRAANPALPSVGIGSYDWDTEVLHGVFASAHHSSPSSTCSNCTNFPPGVTPRPTVFPSGIGLAATFNQELVQASAAIIGREARALNNAILATPHGTAFKPNDMESGQYQGVNGYAPNCNIYRDPRWGRAQETFGESPLHNGLMCAAYVRGLQGNQSVLQLAATVKHYAFYSGPECDHGCASLPGVNRLDFNAVVDEQDAMQTYLPAFHWAVRPVAEGGGAAASVMSSFSHVNGLSMAANKHYLQLLRERFGFGDGLVVTDWGSIGQYEGADKLVPNQPACNSSRCVAQRAVDCLEAGTDMDLRGGYEHLRAAYELGLVNNSAIETSLRRVLDLAFRAGRFDPATNPYRKVPLSTIGGKESRAVAARAAVESLVLVKNAPLHPSSTPGLPVALESVRGIAVIGPSGDNYCESVEQCYPGNQLGLGGYAGDYASCDTCETNHTISIVDGLRAAIVRAAPGLQHAPAVQAAIGCTDGRNGSSTTGFADALTLARSEQISHIIVAVGLDGTLEGEGNDRLPGRFPHGLGLPGVQQQLVEAVAAVGKPTTVIIVAGGAVPLPPNRNISSLIYAFYPGVETGSAVADVYFGHESPAARLPFSIPHSATQLPAYTNFSMVAAPYGRTFSWLQGDGSQQLHEFGFGLTYTKMVYTALIVERSARRSPTLIVTSTLTNKGSVTSDEVVQVYVSWRMNQSAVPTCRVPVRQLAAFTRVRSLASGEQQQVQFQLQHERYALVDSDGSTRTEQQGDVVAVTVCGVQPTAYSLRASGQQGCETREVQF